MSNAQPTELRRCGFCGKFGAEILRIDESSLESVCHNPACGGTEKLENSRTGVMPLPEDKVTIQDTEQIIGWVYGLGRGYIVGFTLVATSKRLIGADYGKQTVRLWSSIIAAILLWSIAFTLLLPVMLRLNLLILIVGFASVFPAVYLASLMSRRGLEQFRKIELTRDSITRISYWKPSRTTGKSLFAVIAKRGSVMRFWAAGKAQDEKTTGLLEKFCTVIEPRIPIIEHQGRLGMRNDLAVFLILAVVLGVLVISILLFRFLNP